MFLVQIVSASYPSLLPYHGGADRYVDATSSIPWQYWSGDRMRERERERERERVEEGARASLKLGSKIITTLRSLSLAPAAAMRRRR